MNEILASIDNRRMRSREFSTHLDIGEEEHQQILEVLKTGILSGFIASKGDSFLGGPKVRQLEGEFIRYFDVRHAVAVNSATAGLHMAISAIGVGPGDEVIVPPYTMTASASSILMQNAIPVFVDIEDDIFCLDPAQIEKAITPQTKAIMVVHLFGHPADMDPIMAIAKEHSLAVIEDCAQAPGAIYKGRLLGTIGDIGIFSLNQNKIISCGEGGVAITSNPELSEEMQLIRNHGEVIVQDTNRADERCILGWNYRMTELEAAVAIAQFKKLDMLTQWRIELANYLTSKLSRYEGIIPPIARPDCRHVYFKYPIKFDEEMVRFSRNIFINAINAEGIPFTAGYVQPLYLEPLYQRKLCYGRQGCPFTCPQYKGKVNYHKGLCPITEALHNKELILTDLCRFPLTVEDMDDIIRAFEKIFIVFGKRKLGDKWGDEE